MSSPVSPAQAHTGWDAKKIALKALIILFKTLVVILFPALSAAAGLATGAYFRLQSLPNVRKLAWIDLHERSEIRTREGVVLKQIFGEENRKIILLKEIPPHVRNAVLAIEDARFKKHTGIDLIGVVRAIKANMESNDVVQGGSTITQQVVKNVFFTPERSYARKAAEAVLSVQVDQTFSKDQILELYLNLIYWGHNAYGIEAAAETYFGKSARNLNLAEAAMLAGLIRGPEAFSPIRNPDRAMAQRRQRETLNKMVENGYITREDAEKAKAEFTKMHIRTAAELAASRQMQHPYFTTYTLDFLKKIYTPQELETKGLKIDTSLEIKMQNHALKVVRERLEKLKNYNIQQGALVALDARTGHVMAIVGGKQFGYGANEFNRAFQAQRQTGSAFKPFVYVTAFENGYTPYTTEVDGPTVYKTGPGSTWSPQNFGRNYHGAMTIRSALMSSINVIAVKVMDKVGMDKVIAMTKRLGIQSEVRPFLSSALGASEITPLEMAQAYSAFANDGILNKASPIVRIEDKNGQVILDNRQPKGKKVIDPDVVRALNYSLMAVVNGGTATAAYIPGYQVAGKTGTTSSHRDAWFMGYTPRIVTAVWVGNDTPTRMYGATGGVFCAPIWKEFMLEAVKTRPNDKFPPELPLRRKRQYSKGTFISSVEPEDEDAKKKKAEQQAAAVATATRARQQTMGVESTDEGAPEVRVRTYSEPERPAVPEQTIPREPVGRVDDPAPPPPPPPPPQNDAPPAEPGAP